MDVHKALEDAGLIEPRVDPRDLYDTEAAAFVATVDKFVTELFGERCADFEPDCPCCRLWKLRDQISEIVIF